MGETVSCGKTEVKIYISPKKKNSSPSFVVEFLSNLWLSSRLTSGWRMVASGHYEIGKMVSDEIDKIC